MSPTLQAMPDRAETRKKLDLIRVVALVDFLMLVVLVAFVIAGSDAVSPVLGPIHGILFLGLVFLTAVGASEKRWPWTFVVTTIIPIFSLIYERRIRKELPAPS